MQNLTANEWVLNPHQSNLPSSAAGTTITFTKAGALSGAGPCNSYRGGFTLDGPIIAIRNVSTTFKSCGPQIMSAEHLYLQALESVHTVAPTHRDELKLTGASNLVLVYEAHVLREPSKG